MDEIGNSAKDPTEYVLSKYLELFNSNCDFFKFFIAQNGVLEWFGRTIKGSNKIHDFLRYEVCPQYDHLLFQTAQICAPFECKSTHMETKQLPTEQDVTINKNTSNNSFDTDQTIVDVQTPISSVKITNVKDRRGSITPPSAAKRFKHDDEHDLNRSFLPLLNIDDYFERKDNKDKSLSSISKSCFQTPDVKTIATSTNSSSDYSELRYFEVIGVLRSCTQPEHRSFRNSNAMNANGTWDRETKLQISYRIRLQDNDIQFALIIYQNVHQYSSLSRRNLMTEFDEAATPEIVAVTTSQSSITRSTPTSAQKKRKIGRRLKLI